ncbi:MAG: DEAD/DEAH box helicase [Chitinophagaceae bacterium]|nr:DEAD/DEAH box helicase [Chitinophagaceae bacterium]
MSFEALNLSAPILTALKSKGYVQPTSVQKQAIPVIIEGRDIFGSAQTGSGKTAAFALPLLQLMSTKPATHRGVRTLVLAPTRELALQIADSFRDYGKHLGLKHVTIFGGVSQHAQTTALRNGVSIIVATPGRLLDLMDQGFVKLNDVEFLVLDEADKMFDMGFIKDIKKIVAKVPANRQTLFFSATLPPEIKQLAASLLRQPVTVEVKPVAGSEVLVEQKLYYVDKINKTALLCDLLKEEKIHQALVFTRTKHGADKLVKALALKGIRASAIHGNKAQNARQRALDDFKTKRITILVATDVASRGIDVKELPYVFNYDLPDQADSYTHRIGRTGRAGASGFAFSFCSADERMLLKDVQKATGKQIPVAEHAYMMNMNQPVNQKEVASSPSHSRSSNNSNTFSKRRRFSRY